jgi:2,4-dienoyl-CoA reductase-like NADH-dependent reductase (Old Yellow Enzyme family)
MGDSHDVAIKPTPESLKHLSRYAEAIQREGTLGIVQLVHPGRQCPAGSGERGFFEKAPAPSPIPLNLGPGLLDRFVAAVLFGTPKEMTVTDIEEVVQQFVTGAKTIYEAGFNGIQLHAAHGYLLSQFLSPKMNQRTDAYGGTAAKRAKMSLTSFVKCAKSFPRISAWVSSSTRPMLAARRAWKKVWSKLA